MTDMPVFGILCCGKDISELGQSVKCCGRITQIMKDSGYALGGYHTAITKRDDAGSGKMCADKLKHLCRTSDVVFTVGSDGFSKDDIIPDITMKICDSEEVFFTSNLCGLSNIGNYDKSNAGFKKEKGIFPPSRSKAGFLAGCLVLNIRNDMDFISSVLPGLIPSVSFAAACACGRDADESKKIQCSLEAFCSVSLAKNFKYNFLIKFKIWKQIIRDFFIFKNLLDIC